MNQLTIDFETARQRADTGIRSSLEHAERVIPSWADTAFALLTRFAATSADPFTIETFRWWAVMRGLPYPPDNRAFGGVTQRALRAGVMVRIGYAPTASSNGSPKALYART